MKSKWWYEKSECVNDAEKEEDPSTKSLQLINVVGVFYILMVGLILSLMAVILEILYVSRLDSIKHNVSLKIEKNFFFLFYNK